MAPFFKKHKEAAKTGKEVDKAGTGAGTGTGKTDGKAQPNTAAADAVPTASDGNNEVLLLDDEDEQFLEHLISNNDDAAPPPLPPRPKTPDLTWDSDSESVQLPKTTTEPTASATTATAAKKQNRFSRLFHRKPSSSNSLTVPTGANSVPLEEADREWADLNRVLSNLGIEPTTTTAAAADDPANKPTSKAKSAALTASAEVQSLLRQFVLVLKDIMNGAPTAVDDLVRLLDGRNDVLKRGFDKLPGSMQKLVTQLPKKLTTSLGPEVLAAAAESQGLKKETDASGLARFLMPKNLGDLVLTPAIVKSMLKGIVNALKLRWPAFVGTNVLWGTAVFLLLFVLWYFHKRGKEEREKREKGALDGEEAGEGKAGEAEGDGQTREELGLAEEGMSSGMVVVEPPVESSRP